MSKRTRRSIRALPVTIAALAGVVFAGSVVAGQLRSPDASAFEADLGTGVVTRVADIPAADGLEARGVFVQVTDHGQFCIWDAPSSRSRQRQGGCNPASDPLGGSALSASLAYEGGPAIESVRDARLIGLVSPQVAKVVLVLSDGSERSLSLRRAVVGAMSLQAFGYRIRPSDLLRGVGPTTVLALDGRGAEIARQATGIG